MSDAEAQDLPESPADSGKALADLGGAASEGRQRAVKELERHVGARVSSLQSALLDRQRGDRSSTVATLARLRRSAADDLGDPAVWDAVFASAPEALLGHGDTPSRSERALHASLVLYATHAQSADGPRHVPRKRLGHAVRELAEKTNPKDVEDGSVARRFRSAASATTWNSAVTHLRGLISLLRSHGIGLDYGSLAGDLYRIQDRDGLRRVRVQWARDFYRVPPPKAATLADEPTSSQKED